MVDKEQARGKPRKINREMKEENKEIREEKMRSGQLMSNMKERRRGRRKRGSGGAEERERERMQEIFVDCRRQ